MDEKMFEKLHKKYLMEYADRAVDMTFSEWMYYQGRLAQSAADREAVNGVQKHVRLVIPRVWPKVIDYEYNIDYSETMTALAAAEIKGE